MALDLAALGTILAAAGGPFFYGYRINSDARTFHKEGLARMQTAANLVRAEFVDRSLERVMEVVQGACKGAKTEIPEKVREGLSEQSIRHHIITQANTLAEADRVEALFREAFRRRKIAGDYLLPALGILLLFDVALFAFYPVFPQPAGIPQPAVLGYGILTALALVDVILVVYFLVRANRAEAEFEDLVTKKTRLLNL